MALMHVPDWDPTRKVKPRDESPFIHATFEQTPTSTYMQHFKDSSSMMRTRAPVRPKPAYPWNEISEGSRSLTRSTAQDSFNPPAPGFKQLPSCKPIREYEPVANLQPLTTTSNSMFTKYMGVQRTLPCRPKIREREDSKFTSRATSQDAYQPIPAGIARREPIYPRSEGAPVITNGGGQFLSTAQASYVPHVVRPYIAAKKPTPALDANFGA